MTSAALGEGSGTPCRTARRSARSGPPRPAPGRGPRGAAVVFQKFLRPDLLGRPAEHRLDLGVDVHAGAADLELLAVDHGRDLLDQGPEAALGLRWRSTSSCWAAAYRRALSRAIEATSANRLTCWTWSSQKVRPGSEKARPITPVTVARPTPGGPRGRPGRRRWRSGDPALPAAVVGDGQGVARLPDPPGQALALEHPQPDQAGVGAGADPQDHLAAVRLDQADVAVGGADDLAGPGDDPLQQPAGGQVVAVGPGLDALQLSAHRRRPSSRSRAPPNRSRAAWS